MNLNQINCLIDHLVQNKAKKTTSDKELIIFYKKKRIELINQINREIQKILTL